MISLETFKTNMVPLNFFANNEDLEEYYNSYNNGFYEVCSCFLQKGFKNYSIISVNSLINPTLTNELISLKPNLTDMELLNVFEEDFLILLTDFYFFEHEGTYHIADLFQRKESDPLIIEMNQQKYFLHHLLKRTFSENNSEMFLRRMFNRILNSPNSNLSESVKMYIITLFLEKIKNKPSDLTEYFSSEDKKEKFFKNIQFYFKLFEAIKNETLITGILFQNIISQEYYTYFFDKLLSYNKMNNLVNSLRLDT